MPGMTQRSIIAGLMCATLWSAPVLAADVAYVSNEQGGISVIDLTTLKVSREFDLTGKIPRGIAVTNDGAYVLTANKDTDDVSVIDTKTGKITRDIKVGDGPEFLRVMGDHAFVTYEPGGRRVDGVAENPDKEDERAEIGVIDLKDWKVVRSIKSGLETEGLEFSRDGKYIVTTNEGDETVSVYDWMTGTHVKTVSTRSYGKRPRGIKVTPDGKSYVVTLEGSNNFVVLDSDFNVVKNVPTKTGPYGVGFDPSGKHMLVAASRASALQIFDAKTFELIQEVTVGARCWHFTYTPDKSKILVACGRTNDIRVIDAQTYAPLASIPDGKLPWGVVTYPRGHGSLDTP
jgi:YVTN family beta-propeller protein